MPKRRFRPRIESQLEEHLLNPVDRKAPPGDDKIPSQKQSTVDTDSTHSSSLEDLSHNYGIFFFGRCFVFPILYQI